MRRRAKAKLSRAKAKAGKGYAMRHVFAGKTGKAGGLTVHMLVPDGVA